MKQLGLRSLVYILFGICRPMFVGTFAVSGGCDDRAFIWNTTTGAAVFELSGHTDSVNAVGFSSDGKYVATGTDLSCLRNRAHSRSLGGLDATVRVYTVVDGKHVITLEGPSESIEVCRECLCVL